MRVVIDPNNSQKHYYSPPRICQSTLLLNNIDPLDNTEKTLANAVQNPTHYTRLLYFAFLACLVNAAAGLRESTEPISRCGSPVVQEI